MGASVVILDRGLLDIAAYLPKAAWTTVLQATGQDERHLLPRYDVVVHLTTAAHGAEEFYKSGHTTGVFCLGVNSFALTFSVVLKRRLRRRSL